MNKVIVGIGGSKRAGKNTSAEILSKKYGFKELSLAQPLKEMCSKVFNIPLDHFTSDDFKDKNFPEPLTITEEHVGDIVGFVGDSEDGITLHQIYALAHNGPNKVVSSPRTLMQVVGTELIRQCVDQNYWCKALIRDMEPYNKVVITDVRLPNERKFIRQNNGKLVLITRPELFSADSHSSETSLGDHSEYDLIVENSSSVEDLHNKIDGWYLSGQG